jgi:hypothetical protein
MLLSIKNPEKNKKELVFVYDLKQAIETVNDIIEKYNIGSNDWYISKNIGNVYEEGIAIANISYNGRCWNVDNKGNIAEPRIEIIL